MLLTSPHPNHTRITIITPPAHNASNLRDLLGGPSAPYISDQNAIKHDPSGGHTTVTGVTRVPVCDPGAAATLVQRAAAARSCEVSTAAPTIDPFRPSPFCPCSQAGP